MPYRDLEDNFDFMVQNGAGRGEDFLRVLQSTCQQQCPKVILEIGNRSWKEGGGVVMKGTLPHGRELQVFAEDHGPHLQVGYQLATTLLGGKFLGQRGMFLEVNKVRTRGQDNPNAIRELSGIMQTFQNFVFLPVCQQLAEAVIHLQGRSQNGFLGA